MKIGCVTLDQLLSQLFSQGCCGKNRRRRVLCMCVEQGKINLLHFLGKIGRFHFFSPKIMKMVKVIFSSSPILRTFIFSVNLFLWTIAINIIVILLEFHFFFAFHLKSIGNSCPKSLLFSAMNWTELLFWKCSIWWREWDGLGAIPFHLKN